MAVWAEHDDPSAGSSSPHLEFIPYSANGAYPLSGPAAGFKDLYAASPWADWGLIPTGPLAEATTDEEIDNAIRNLAGNGYHAMGTAMMTPEDAPFGVVNPDLRVKKVSGLRIVDASIMPHLPAAHTVGPVYAIAERAADLVKAFWAAND
ncbi:GMC oxidoreductase-domain-containing protein [Coprinopsis sp. MPI-PUGE-AT-0042]|nr:GMC oxidoreductase-domain-containing protein [Coprinopsis sp. MPI-PUGE-AT-0042]